MDTPIAAIIAGNPRDGVTARLGDLLEFFGVPWQSFKDVRELQHATVTGPLRGHRYSILGSITHLAELIENEEDIVQQSGAGAESLFCYLDQDIPRCSQVLRQFLGCPDAALMPLGGTPVEVGVSTSFPELTGPMHGVRATVTPGRTDYALVGNGSSPVFGIIETKDSRCFFEVERRGLRMFVSCSGHLPDLKGPLKGRYYDVKDDFLSAVPIVTFLKWAFRDSGWQAIEQGACLIIDDPILRMKYGFVDLRQLDVQMREIGFTTNISFIPWNWRRTSDAAAALVRNSHGRFSISIHGCDHTGGEFATRAIPALNRKVTLARQRMDNHQIRTGVPYDPIMVFPQGAFSRESLAVLQQHQFLAAINTEVFPADGSEETITIADVWSVAIMKYGSFPVFTRRYPKHGLENLAFDLLLGKPCFIVEHHDFFKNGGRDALEFIRALNSLNCRLQWRSPAEVARRAYQWRVDEGAIHVRMFANELVLDNQDSKERFYEIEKADEGSAGVEGIQINDRPVNEETNGTSIAFKGTIPPQTKMLIQVFFRSSLVRDTGRESLKSRATTALRRYLSEFRDTIPSLCAPFVFNAQIAKSRAVRR